MRIDFRIDTTRLFERLRNGEKRLAFAAVNAINATAKAIQSGERAEVERDFEVRKPFVVRQAAVIKPFANVAQGRPFAEVSIGKAGTGAPLLLPIFTEGGEKPTRRSTAAVPITGSPARPSFGSSVPAEYRYTRLRLRKRFRGGKRDQRRTGLRDTYEVPEVGVFQRRGGESELIYGYGPRPKLDRRLRWIERAQAIAREVFAEEMERETIKAIGRG